MKFARKIKVLIQVIFGILLFFGGVFLGKHLFKQPAKAALSQSDSVSSIREGNGKYTNPLLECDQSQGEFVELKPFNSKIDAEVSSLEKDPEISLVSLYFRDLNNGPWFGVNLSATFSPASLLKVPLAIAYYKLNEQTPGYINKTIKYNGPQSDWPNIVQTIVPQQVLKIGEAYSIEDLIDRMLVYSDNQAYFLLYSNISQDDLQKVYDDFDLKLNGPGPQDDSTVNVKGYSTFFRILFNASYLNQTDSEKVLSDLASSDFTSALSAGVPDGTQVAHKFGEREIEGSSTDQIHDCGIVYYPGHPYLLCVMTQGSDINKQIGAIKQISSEVYGEVSSQSPGN